MYCTLYENKHDTNKQTNKPNGISEKMSIRYLRIYNKQQDAIIIYPLVKSKPNAFFRWLERTRFKKDSQIRFQITLLPKFCVLAEDDWKLNDVIWISFIFMLCDIKIKQPKEKICNLYVSLSHGFNLSWFWTMVNVTNFVANGAFFMVNVTN